MTYIFDIDGTICTHAAPYYENARPFVERIQKINSLYDAGHTIIIETARGNVSGIDWYTSTENQLKTWGLKFHTLRTGVKHAADIYIDDKALNADEFFYAVSMTP